MKIQQKKIEHKQILELQLLKSRVYEQYNKKANDLENINLTKIMIDFKKVFKVIFKYHKKNKKILFVGITSTLMKKINRTTNHIALPSEFKLKGFLSNNSKLKNQHTLIQTNNFHLLPKLNTKPDLIVIFDRLDNNNSSILTESYLAKIPTVTFGEKRKKRSNFHSYYVPGNLDFLFSNNGIFHICLKFLFKTPTKINKTRKLIKNESKKKI